ncbi:MAG TPA: hypothetical protein DD666_13875 [Advenella kashmirensis]|jgi:hypothetical protein|uniref:Alpha/beta hydrolase n=1 Tax=Advenella kashmirensis TaxID=310575 RepID=A0A356LIU9_9BURK|nr:hypothetical protein [Advenella kashmirensis]
MGAYFTESSGHFMIEDVYCKFNIVNRDKPVIITFAGAGDYIRSHQANKGMSPWGFEFAKKESGNVISFAAIDVSNWYRNDRFETFVDQVAEYISDFPLRLGYGGSMGGFGISAFSNKLRLDRILLINPISTLNKTEAPWEKRFSWASRYDWNNGCYDGKHVAAPGYVVYDPLHKIDKLHAQRYPHNIKHLRVYGVGHSMARHLQSMKMLKKLYLDFVNDSINEQEFYTQARARRKIDQYYKRLLAPFNKHLSPARAEILNKHRAVVKRNAFFAALGINQLSSAPLAGIVLKSTLSAGGQGVGAKCNDLLLRLGARDESQCFWSSWNRGKGFLKNGGLKFDGDGYLPTLVQAEKVVLHGNFDIKRPSNGFLLGFLSSLNKDIGTVIVSKEFKLKNTDGLSPEQQKLIEEFRAILR